MMPQESYLPTATLKEILTYPAGVSDATDQSLRDALVAVGLDRYVDRLDQVERWDRLLDKEEEASLQVANALLRRPDWLIIDDVLEGLEAETRERLVNVLAGLERTTLVYIGRSEEFAQAFSPHVFHLAPLQSAEEAGRRSSSG